MAKDLIIVESPAKVKTIKKFLGAKYIVEASVGHIRDLPSKNIGIDEENDFKPQYQIITGKEKIVETLRNAAAKADTVYLAPDPDREGEAIAWHIAELIKDKNTNVKRIQFNEITAKAVKEALENPSELNENLFDAQQARRILDRLVGYKVSPILWNKVKRGISAGRVQSVALRLVVDRERERQAFKPEEYWTFRAHFKGANDSVFKADLQKISNKKAVIPNKEKADAIDAIIAKNPFIVSNIEEKERKRHPQPPFITSTLQQNANQRLGFSSKRTMQIAQRLYEGVALGELGTQALITYMRTDSVRISSEAQDEAKKFIITTYGKEYFPKSKNVYKSKGSAQDAHEAIRPVDCSITPDSIRAELPPDQYQLYKLVWSRFMASQMAAASFHDTTVSIECGTTGWKSKGERLLFPGFLKVLAHKDDDTDMLPPLNEGDTLILTPPKIEKEQKFTQPPARYSEASIVRELEEKGIGRPSTYATIISTLVDRDYVRLEEKHFVPTDLGLIVCDKLTKHFVTLMDVDFTAKMEENLDKVAEGNEDWVKLLQSFNKDFTPALQQAAKEMDSVKQGLETDIICETCQKPMLVKFGKTGPFLACSGYPDCKTTHNFTRDAQGNIKVEVREAVTHESLGKCPDCEDGELILKKARTGSRFIACTNYPACKHTEAFSTNVPCPREGCTGEIVEKSSKRGKLFYACNQYPKCDFAMWNLPVEKPCPVCNFPVLEKKSTKAKGPHLACPEKSCKYTEEIDE